MQPNAPRDGMEACRCTPFSVLVQGGSELAEIRREHAGLAPEERRKAADYAYHAEAASELIDQMMGRSGENSDSAPYWPSGYVALAIDPNYAPGLLTVGSVEYQLGRPEEAMALFHRLTTLPADVEDLAIIIDKAGDFLIDEDDLENALELYGAAWAAFPGESTYAVGMGYCLGGLGRHEESVEAHRRAVALEPDNYLHRNDLGYSLLEAGRLDEAEAEFKKSISLAPDDYELPKGNLREVALRRASGTGS